VWRGASE